MTGRNTTKLTAAIMDIRELKDIRESDDQGEARLQRFLKIHMQRKHKKVTDGLSQLLDTVETLLTSEQSLRGEMKSCGLDVAEFTHRFLPKIPAIPVIPQPSISKDIPKKAKKDQFDSSSVESEEDSDEDSEEESEEGSEEDSEETSEESDETPKKKRRKRKKESEESTTPRKKSRKTKSPKTKKSKKKSSKKRRKRSESSESEIDLSKFIPQMKEITKDDGKKIKVYFCPKHPNTTYTRAYPCKEHMAYKCKGKKKFVCEMLTKDKKNCGKNISRKQNLLEHQCEHTGVDKYHCKWKGCDITFSHSRNKSDHELTCTHKKEGLKTPKK